MPQRNILNPDLTLSAIMTRWPQTVSVFLKYGMLCVGCRISPFHTLNDACAAYNLEEGAFGRELQDAIRAAHPVRPE